MPPVVGERAFVYWNLHRECWSVRVRGKVVAHATGLTLERVEFKVSEAGRQRVLRERRKNVHAGAYGMVVEVEPARRPPGLRGVGVSYNPYRGPSFYRVETGEPVTGAPLVYLEPGRRVTM